MALEYLFDVALIETPVCRWNFG